MDSLREPLSPPPRPARLDSIDFLRGLVIVLMALDHVRDFFHFVRGPATDEFFVDPVDMSKTTPSLFLTRWVTHFCAPTFIFLAGTGAFLSGTRGKSKAELSWFLFSRGLWLLFLELTVIRGSWMFNWDMHEHGAGVFWSLGWGMIVLAALVHLPYALIAALGLACVAFHNLMDGRTAAQVGLPDWLWILLHSEGKVRIAGFATFETNYFLIPWVAVMALGYCFGLILQLEPRRRRRELLGLGLGLVMVFVLVRGANIYGDPLPWSVQHDALMTVLSFLNCNKYPPSLLYVLMTLGPAILILAWVDGKSSRWMQPILVFGRVPLFFYLLHIPLIHGGAVMLDLFRYGWSPLAWHGNWDVFPDKVPEGYGVSLPMVYLIWIAVLVILYPVCRWYADYKRRSRSVWLSYL
jgi:uncharacterized membrane protein